MSKEKNRCFLASAIDGEADSTDYDFFKAKWDGAAGDVDKPCQRLADFFAYKSTDPKGTWAAQMEVTEATVAQQRVLEFLYFASREFTQ